MRARAVCAVQRIVIYHYMSYLQMLLSWLLRRRTWDPFLHQFRFNIINCRSVVCYVIRELFFLSKSKIQTRTFIKLAGASTPELLSCIKSGSVVCVSICTPPSPTSLVLFFHVHTRVPDCTLHRGCATQFAGEFNELQLNFTRFATWPSFKITYSVANHKPTSIRHSHTEHIQNENGK